MPLTNGYSENQLKNETKNDRKRKEERKPMKNSILTIVFLGIICNIHTQWNNTTIVILLRENPIPIYGYVQYPQPIYCCLNGHHYVQCPQTYLLLSQRTQLRSVSYPPGPQGLLLQAPESANTETHSHISTQSWPSTDSANTQSQQYTKLVIH